MTDEIPIEIEALPEARKRAPRAKPQIEVEIEKKAEEARIARTVGRAAPLMEAERQTDIGDRTRMVTCTVLNKGEGRIHTGEIDPTNKRPSFYAASETFEVPEPDAIRLEQRGYAQRVR